MTKLALSIAEAARSSSLSRSYLYRQISAGAIPTIRVGGRRLILCADFETYLASFRQVA